MTLPFEAIDVQTMAWVIDLVPWEEEESDDALGVVIGIA